MANDKKTRIGLRVTIYKRGQKGIYVADFHYDGRHCRKSLGTTKKDLATQKAVAIEFELLNGCFQPQIKQEERKIPISQINTAQASCDYISYLKAEGRRRKTVVKYEGILRVFTQFALDNGVSEPSQIDLVLIDKFRELRKPSLSEKSMHHEGSLLKRFFSWAIDRQLMTANPLANRVFRAPRAKPRGGPTLEQINAILAASTDARRPIIAVAAFAGMRIGEITRLRIEDVDFKNNWLHIESRPSFETKSGDSWKVPIHPRLRMILENLPRAKAGWFFTSRPSRIYPNGGHHINPKHANEDFIKILIRQGIASGREAGFTFHSLRASFKTICVNGGIPKEAVDVWQNHAPDRAASNVYYALTDEESQRLMRKAPFDRE